MVFIISWWMSTNAMSLYVVFFAFWYRLITYQSNWLIVDIHKKVVTCPPLLEYSVSVACFLFSIWHILYHCRVQKIFHCQMRFARVSEKIIQCTYSIKDNTMHLFKCTKQKIIQCTYSIHYIAYLNEARNSLLLTDWLLKHEHDCVERMWT